jgi:hypothetical protein
MGLIFFDLYLIENTLLRFIIYSYEKSFVFIRNDGINYFGVQR